MNLVHWPLMGRLLHLVQRGGNWAGPQRAQAPPCCTKCNSRSTASVPITVLQYNGPLLCCFNIGILYHRRILYHPNHILSPVHTGDKVEFNTVDFVQSRPCGFGPVHTGNEVDRIGNKVERIWQQSTLLPICCRFRQQSTFNKVDRIEFNFNVETSYFTQLKICYLMTTFRCPSDILITS